MTTPGTPARRRAPRLTAAAVAASVVLTALIAPLSAAASPSPDPTPSATHGVAAGTTELTLSPVGNGVLRPGEPLNVQVALQNATDAPTAPVEATLALGTAALNDRQELSAWLDGDAGIAEVTPVGVATLGPVDPGAEVVQGITVAADDPAIAGRAPGVYPLVVSYPGDAGPVTATSAVIVPSADAQAHDIGIIVPITAGAIAEGLLDADELAELTGPDGALTAQLDAVEGTPAILAIDPAIPAAIRVLGTSAPTSAKEWVARLDELPNPRFALQFGDADVTPQLQAGLGRPLAPTSFAAYTVSSQFAAPTPTPTGSATTGPTPTATPTVQPGEPVAPPTTDELLEIGPDARSDVYWPADGSAGPDVIAQLGALGDEDDASVTIVPSTATSEGADGDAVAARATAEGAALLVYDAAASAALADAAQRETTWLRGASLTAATAYLSFASAATDGPLLVTLGRAPLSLRSGIGSAITAATSAPGASPVALDALLAATANAVGIVAPEPDPARVDVVNDLTADEAELARFATILDEPALLTSAERAEMLQLLGVAWIGDEEWPEALTEHREATARTLDSVGLLPSSSGDLWGSSANLRFWVRNDLPYPVNLVLYTSPDSFRLDVQPETPVVATPSSNTRVEVPVEARVGRGDVTLALQLRSPAFIAIGDPQSVDVSVRADWETTGLTILAVLVGGLLVVGIVRTVLRFRRRRARQTDAEGAASVDESASANTGEGENADARSGEDSQ